MQSFPVTGPISLYLFSIICKSSQSCHRLSDQPRLITVQHQCVATLVFRSRGGSTSTAQGAHAGGGQGQDVLLTGSVLSKAGIVSNDATGSLVAVEGDGQRLSGDEPVDALGARGSGQGSGVAVGETHVSMCAYYTFINRCDGADSLCLPLEGGAGEHGNEAGHGESRRLGGGSGV